MIGIRKTMDRLVANVGSVARWLLLVLVACSASGGESTVDPGGSDASDTSEFVPPDVGGDAECLAGDPNDDYDGDGYTIAQGDCNDCSIYVNPGAYDFPGNGVDEDCNGIVDDEPDDCDTDLVDAEDPQDAARSLGLCRFTAADAIGKDRTWGVIRAAYVFADGSASSAVPFPSQWPCVGSGGVGAPPNPLSYGVLPKFGIVTPPHGGSMVLLSTGVAREVEDRTSPQAGVMCTKSATPPGFPTPSTAACPDTIIDDTPVAHDPVALELNIRVPTNARSFSFYFNFYTVEYPDWICKAYNDFFVTLLYSNHPDTPSNNNISFDKLGNPVSVNNGFLEVCDGCTYNPFELEGTGFEQHAATGWLQTVASVLPGEEITLRFAIWDMRDEYLDSAVLIDFFRWDLEPGQAGTVRPPLY